MRFIDAGAVALIYYIICALATMEHDPAAWPPLLAAGLVGVVAYQFIKLHPSVRGGPRGGR